jgi:hypothetical protein
MLWNSRWIGDWFLRRVAGQLSRAPVPWGPVSAGSFLFVRLLLGQFGWSCGILIRILSLLHKGLI